MIADHEELVETYRKTLLYAYTAYRMLEKTIEFRHGIYKTERMIDISPKIKKTIQTHPTIMTTWNKQKKLVVADKRSAGLKHLDVSITSLVLGINREIGECGRYYEVIMLSPYIIQIKQMQSAESFPIYYWFFGMAGVAENIDKIYMVSDFLNEAIKKIYQEETDRTLLFLIPAYFLPAIELLENIKNKQPDIEKIVEEICGDISIDIKIQNKKIVAETNIDADIMMFMYVLPSIFCRYIYIKDKTITPEIATLDIFRYRSIKHVENTLKIATKPPKKQHIPQKLVFVRQKNKIAIKPEKRKKLAVWFREDADFCEFLKETTLDGMRRFVEAIYACYYNPETKNVVNAIIDMKRRALGML